MISKGLAIKTIDIWHSHIRHGWMARLTLQRLSVNSIITQDQPNSLGRL